MKTREEISIEAIRMAVETGVTDREFWHSRTPQERLCAMELMRQRKYGYDEHCAPKLQRVIEFDTLKRYEPRPREAQKCRSLP